MKPEPIQFEAVKTALRQSKEGYVLSLAVHPDDLPGDLMRDFVGSRYVVVMVRLGDDEQPIARDGDPEGETAVKLAGILCRDPKFWDWLHEKEWLMEKNEEAATEWLTDYLHIESRRELKSDREARDLFLALRRLFNAWRES